MFRHNWGDLVRRGDFISLRASMLKFARWAWPGRYSIVALAVAIFLAVSTALRIGLAVYEFWTADRPANILPILLVGLVYDLAAAAFLIVPFVFVALFVPNN